jgi:hypothetical protein
LPENSYNITHQLHSKRRKESEIERKLNKGIKEIRRNERSHKKEEENK